MTDTPPMPVIGASVAYLGGTITRANASNFRVTLPTGRKWSGANRTSIAAIAYISALNALRRHAKMPMLDMPCRICGVRPRKSKNSVCSECGNRIRRGEPVDETPILKMDDVMAILAKIAPNKPQDVVDASAPQIAPEPTSCVTGASLRQFRQALDAKLRARSDCKRYIPREGYIRPERYAQEWSA